MSLEGIACRAIFGSKSGSEAVAVLVHNKPSAYLVPAATYKRLLERLEDLDLADLVRARAKERRVKVSLDALWADIWRIAIEGMAHAGSTDSRTGQSETARAAGSPVVKHQGRLDPRLT